MNQPLAKNGSDVLFQSAYGQFQPRYRWLVIVVLVIGLVGAPVGIFWNRGWEFGNRPLEPWAATLIIEIFSVGALLIAAYVGLAQWRQRKSPQRVAITSASLIVPKGPFSSQELVLPLTEINTALFNAGFVKQLQVKHGRKKLLLVSAMFPSDDDFDRFAGHLLR